MNKQAFVAAVRAEIISRYGDATKGDCWAADAQRLERFMHSVHATVYTSQSPTNIDSESFRAAWRAIGGKGRPTYKGLKAMPEGC